MTYSRRTFLKLTGSMLISTILRPALAFTTDVPAVSGWGRALTALPIFHSQEPKSAVVGYLWPDSIISMDYINENWYAVTGGYVQRELIQPIAHGQPEEQVFQYDFPHWAEVAGPVASVRAFCAADAPLVTRIGHGGVARVVDGLPGEPNGWYQIADDRGTVLGWTQAALWRPVDIQPEPAIQDERHIVIDRLNSTIVAYQAGIPVLKAGYSAGKELPEGTYQAVTGTVGGGRWSGDTTYHGLPWQIRLSDDHDISGVYWHNRFGQPTPGPTVQIPPAIAHWLYEFIGQKTAVVAN